MSKIITHPVLGDFRKTGVVRCPQAGDYYLGPLTKMVCLANGVTLIRAEILEMVTPDVKVRKKA